MTATTTTTTNAAAAPRSDRLPPLQPLPPCDINNNQEGPITIELVAGKAAVAVSQSLRPSKTKESNNSEQQEPRTSARKSSSRRKSLLRSILCCFSTSVTRQASATAAKQMSNELATDMNTNTNRQSFVKLNTTMISSPISSVSSSACSDYTSSANTTTIDDTTNLTTDSCQNLIHSVSQNQVVSSSSLLMQNAAAIYPKPGLQYPETRTNRNVILYESSSSEDSEGNSSLLPPIRPSDTGRKCLIIDLDETLVHSSFKQVNNADFVVPVEIDGVTHQVYVLKRPFVDEFLKRMGELFECVLFTASLAKYADPVADLLDKGGVFRARLFRESCVFYRGNYVKDLSRLGRDISQTIILDNSPASYIFHPDNAVPCTSWFDDMHDSELMELVPHFERLAATDNIYALLQQSQPSPQTSSSNSDAIVSTHCHSSGSVIQNVA